jgi:hypothetical protein
VKISQFYDGGKSEYSVNIQLPETSSALATFDDENAPFQFMRWTANEYILYVTYFSTMTHFDSQAAEILFHLLFDV